MITSILRTIVPALWGSLIGWVFGIIPALEPAREQLLSLGALAVPVISAVIIGAWYALWRWVEPHLPAWLTAALLGSPKSPTYAKHAANTETVDWHEAVRRDRETIYSVDGE